MIAVAANGGRAEDTVYFIDRGFASVVADAQGKREIEVGIIGREGMTGLAVVLGQDRAQHASYIQMAGAGRRISAAILRQAMAQSAILHQSFLRCVHAFLTQTSETAGRIPPAAARPATGVSCPSHTRCSPSCTNPFRSRMVMTRWPALTRP